MRRKILAVASQGGHWIQLKRLCDVFERHNTMYLTTYDGPKRPLRNKNGYFEVKDASRWNKMMLILQFYKVLMIILRTRPDVIITTGASVGIWAILIGRLFGCKTIWIDSLANYECVSLSGRIVKNISTYHLTQWEHLSDDKTLFKGSVL